MNSEAREGHDRKPQNDFEIIKSELADIRRCLVALYDAADELGDPDRPQDVVPETLDYARIAFVDAIRSIDGIESAAARLANPVAPASTASAIVDAAAED